MHGAFTNAEYSGAIRSGLELYSLSHLDPWLRDAIDKSCFCTCRWFNLKENKYPCETCLEESSPSIEAACYEQHFLGFVI